jgi:hypothetical protein
MTDLVTPAQTEDALKRLSSQLRNRTEELPKLLDAAAEAEVVYRVEYAKALLTSTQTSDAKRAADATIQCEHLLRARRSSAAVANACRVSIDSLRDRLSAVQSLNANVRYAAGLSS